MFKKIVYSLLSILFIFNSVNISAKADGLPSKGNADQKNDEDIYVEEITLNADEIEKYKKGNKIVFHPRDIKLAKNVLDNVERTIDLEVEKIEEEKAKALRAGYTWEHSKITVSTRYVDNEGNLLKVKDYKKIKQATNGEVGIYRTYPYMAISVDEWSSVDSATNKKRHYLIYGASWYSFGYGYVNKVANDAVDDLAIMAWSIGPTNYDDSSRQAIITFKSYGGSTISRNLSYSSQHENSGANSLAFKVPEWINQNGTYYGVSKVNMYAYTGWYTRGSIGQDGAYSAKFAHGYKSLSLSYQVGVSYPTGVSIGVTPTSVDQVDSADVWATLSTN